MSTSNPNIRLLFARLEWPSLMVRERAATQLALLLKDIRLRDEIAEALIAWLSSRMLESLAANVLLIPLRLKIEGIEVFSDCSQLTGAIHYPSALSHVLLVELYNDHTISFQWENWHSGSAPSTFTSSVYFERYKTANLPPIYEMRARSIENDLLIAFQRQWAYEWECIIKRTGLPESGFPHYFLHVSKGEPLTVIDVPQGEAYRSAYLRALAWAVDIGGISEDVALIRALECCPIDIGIWQVQPSAKPNWWPCAEASEKGLDKTPGQIWSQVETLWKDQQKSKDQVLIHASGHIVTTETSVYDLEIHGAFQRFEGGQDPPLEDVAHWLTWENSLSPIRMTSIMGWEMPYPYISVNKYVRNFDGWSLAPAAFRLQSWTTPRWQVSLMYRGVWMAAPYLVTVETELISSGTSLELRSGDRTLANWQTWHEHLQERWYADVPPGVGECLWSDQNLIWDFCDLTKSSFCWIVRLRFYHRKYSTDAFQSADDLRSFGISHIII